MRRLIARLILKVQESELGHLSLAHGHNGLHVRLEEVGNDSVVQSRVSGRFELHLVDIAIGVADRAGDEFSALGETLDEGEHLRPHLAEQLAVGQVK